MFNVRLAGGNSCSPGCRRWCLWLRLFVMSFFPLDVLDEIWDLIESVTEGFLTYSYQVNHDRPNLYQPGKFNGQI